MGTGVDSMMLVGGGIAVEIGGSAVAREIGVTTEAGWQPKVRRETRLIIQNSRMKCFMSASFVRDYRSKSRCIENGIIGKG